MNVREVVNLFYDLASETDRTSDRAFALECIGEYVNAEVHGVGANFPWEWIPAVRRIVSAQITESNGEMREGFVEGLAWLKLVAAEYNVQIDTAPAPSEGHPTALRPSQR